MISVSLSVVVTSVTRPDTMGDVGSNFALAQRCNMCWKVRGVSGKERAHSDIRVLCSCSMLMILPRQQYCSKFTVVVV